MESPALYRIFGDLLGGGVSRTVTMSATSRPPAARQADVLVRGGHGDATARGAGQHALLDEERLVHVFDGLGLLADADGQGAEAHRTAVELLADRREDRPVDLVETAPVDAEQLQAILCRGHRDGAVATHLGVVANAPQQPIGDSWRASRTAGDLPRSLGRDADVQDSGGATHDRLQLVVGVVVETGDQAEPVAQWTGDHAGARGRARPA